MSYIKSYHSLGKTHEIVLDLNCGHSLGRSTQLNEDQAQASFLADTLFRKMYDRSKGLPEIDFDINCPVCNQITKFSQLTGISLTWDWNLVAD